MAKIKKADRKRVVIAFLLIMIAFTVMLFKVAWVQIVRGQYYKDMAIAQQTKDAPIQPKRGSILDRKGEELATSAIRYSVWIRPKDVRDSIKEKDSSVKKIKIEDMAGKIAAITGQKPEEVEEDINSKNTLMPLKKYLSKSEIDKFRALDYSGFEVVEEPKRYYPLGDFAAVLLGSVNDEGVGRSGVEQEYNKYLSGIAGRSVKNTDIEGNSLSYGQKRYYQQEDGYDVVLTLDEVLQHYLEDAMATGLKKTKAKQIWGIVMDPKTGDILAMGTNPTFNPNNPSQPEGKAAKAAFKDMSAEEQSKYLSSMWRNPLVSDVYEPGSTFKLLTASSVLEEGIATLDTTFTCNGGYNVDGVTLHCWSPTPHGTITLRDAVGKSCNPAHMQMALKLGKDKYYDYLALFGITKPTGIDLPAEASALIQNKKDVGNVVLATMGYGQGIAVTPVQLVSAVSAIGNDGILMQPRVAKELRDQKGKVVKEFPTKEVKKVLSENTAQEMREIMEYEVAESGGQTAKIPGFRIGGKTGTANKAEAGGYSSDTYCSFICMAPINDPKMTVLIVVDTPKVGVYGSDTAAPIAKDFLTKALPYLGVSPQFDQGDKAVKEAGYEYVPDVTGMKYKDAVAALAEHGLKAEIRPSLQDDEKDKEPDFTVVDQYPKAGKKIKKDEKVYIYRE